MNIQFKEINIKGFRSIDSLVYDFSNNGTTIVKGINEYEQNTNSNGSGKSSIFEAIVYCLFEETSSGDKDVQNRILDNGCEVSLDFKINQVEYRIIRQINKNKSSVILYKNGIDISARNKTDTNKLICSILIINKNIFLDSIFLSQNVKTNLTALSPSNRKERLEVLSNTDVKIILFKEEIKEKLDNELNNNLQINKQFNILEGVKSSKLSDIQSIQNQIAEIEEENQKIQKENNMEEINIKLKEAEDRIKQKEENNNNLAVSQNEINSKIEEIEQQIEEQNNLIILEKDAANIVKNSLSKIHTEIYFLNKEQMRLQEEIKNIEKESIKLKNSDKCPTCGQKIKDSDELHISNLIAQNEEEIKNLNNEIDLNKNKIEELNNNLIANNKEEENLNNKIYSLNDMLSTYKILLQVKKDELNELNNDYEVNNINIKKEYEIINSLNKFKEDLLNNKIKSTKELELNKERLEKELMQNEEDSKLKNKELEDSNLIIETLKHISFLITKDFRTYLLQNSIQFLNKLLKNYSNALFSNEQDVINIKESDSKLDIMLGDATYESLSGGEQTRVNIALLLAQKKLASAVGDIYCNIIILDEILGYCDSKAENKIIDLITNELDNLESIYMISHKELPIAYDSELIIVKNSQGLSNLK